MAEKILGHIPPEMVARAQSPVHLTQEEPTVVLAGANITPRSPEGRNYEFNALELPTNLQVTAMEVVPETGRLQNAFTWDAIEDAQIYEFTLYARATGSGQPFEMEYWAQTYTPEMQLSGYSPSYDYRWSVKAIRYYETTREVYGPAFASEAYPLVPPTGMVTTNIFSDAATLGWNPVIGVHGYEVQLNDNPDLVFTAGGFGREVMSYTMTDLAPATTYSWRVRARIGSEYSEWSGAVDFVTSSVGSWDMNTISGMPYSSSADPMNTTWPSAWAGSISHSGYTYQFSNGFATDYYLPVKVRSDRFFLDNTSTLDILRLQDGNTVELRAAAFQLVENGTMLRIVPMTGCSIELIWNDAAKTLTFPTIYDGAELVYSIYAFLYDEGIPDIVGYYTSLSSYYSNVVMTVDTAAGGGTRMSATRVNIAPSRIDGVGSALATPEMPVRGIVTGSVYYTTSLTR